MYKNFNDPIQAFKAKSTSSIENFLPDLLEVYYNTYQFLKRNGQDNPDRLHGDLKQKIKRQRWAKN